MGPLCAETCCMAMLVKQNPCRRRPHDASALFWCFVRSAQAAGHAKLAKVLNGSPVTIWCLVCSVWRRPKLLADKPHRGCCRLGARGGNVTCAVHQIPLGSRMIGTRSKVAEQAAPESAQPWTLLLHL